MTLFEFVLLIATAPPPEMLRVDFGHSSTPTSQADLQAGFVDLSAANQGRVLMGRAGRTWSQSIAGAFGRQGHVAISLEANHPRFSSLAFRDRGNMQGDWSDLAEDFVFNEAALRLTLNDLKPGLYTMRTWHHDAQYHGGLIDIRVQGRLVCGGVRQTTGTTGEPGSAAFTFVADGDEPVTIDFVSQSQDDKFVAYLNGFSMSRVSPIAAFDVDGPERAVTQAFFGVKEGPFVSLAAHDRPDLTADGGIAIRIQGADSEDLFDSGGRGALAGNAYASLFRDFIRTPASAPQPLVIQIAGLQPATDYLLTWFAYDVGDRSRHPMFVYQDRVEPERLRFTTVSQLLYTKDNVLEGGLRSGQAAHTFPGTADERGEIVLVAGRGDGVGSNDPADGPVEMLLNGLTLGPVADLPHGWLTLFKSSARAIPQSAINPAGDSLAKDYTTEVELIPPTEPEDAEATFEVEPGFRVELVAAEPLVADPVGLSFDERGRLFVAEMRGYNQGNLVPSSEARQLAEQEPLGCVRLLEDTDGDGRFDKSTIYVDDLVWPNGVIAYEGGVFVAAAPNLLYCKDLDEDGVADLRKVVYSGFGYSNWQHLPNSFRWGLDNQIHAASGSGGGLVRCLVHPNASPVQIRGRDFSFDPRTLELTPTNTSAQFGLSFDDWGRKFLTSNSDHILEVFFQDRYIARNPFLVAPRSWQLIAAEGRGADVFRISPPEPHRVVWMRMRASGVIKGIIERGGAPTGYITAASGTTIYRGDAWPESYLGNAFTPECSGNLIHRNTLHPHGVGHIARRADPGREFLASRDIWFRPVNMVNGPDGNLYLADMYRQVINEGVVLPPALRKCFDLTEGRNRGRIYRITPEGFHSAPVPNLGRYAVDELVNLLQHPNAWHRTTAARLLFERQDASAKEPLLRLAMHSPSPLGRMHALWALEGQRALSPKIILRALEDTHPRCREHAVRLSESVLAESDATRQKLYEMVNDPDARARYQLAYTLGEIPDTDATQALARLATRDASDNWFRLAILSSANRRSGALFGAIFGESPKPLTQETQTLLLRLADLAGLHRQPDQLQRMESAIEQVSTLDHSLARSVVRQVVSGMATSNRPFCAQWLRRGESAIGRIYSEMLDEAVILAADDRANAERRVAAIQLLSLASSDQVVSVLESLVHSRQPHVVAQAALETLGSFPEPQVVHVAMDAWPGLTPQLRTVATDAIFARRDRLPLLLAAIEDEVVRPSQLDATRIQFLTTHPDTSVRERAIRCLGEQGTSQRKEVIEAFLPALAMKGDLQRGREAFRRVCAKCHRLEGVGHDLGLPLNALQDQGRESVLRHVLDPNQNINPQYVNYVILTEEGRVLTGMIVSETANSITLDRGDGERDAVLRNAIEEIRDTGMSIMPEGLEKELTRQDMADLLHYLEIIN